MAPLRKVPRVPWATLRADLARNWKAGQHVTVIGPTRSGKTHLALTLAEMCSHILVLATKRTDPLVTELRAKGYLITGDLSQIMWATSDDGKGTEPVHKKVVYWPQFPESMSTVDRLKAQKALFAKAMDWADVTKGWAVVIDETMWMADRLLLTKELDSLWYSGRTAGLSVIACAQRPSRVPRLAFSQADYLFLAKFADKRDIETLRDISSAIPKELIDDTIRQLSKEKHEFLFLDTVNDKLAVTVAPPR